MTCRMEMFARVLMGAGVTAADVATGQAHPQVCPCVLAVLVAFLAFAGGERLRFCPGCSGRSEVFACIGDRHGAGIAAT